MGASWPGADGRLYRAVEASIHLRIALRRRSIPTRRSVIGSILVARVLETVVFF